MLFRSRISTTGPDRAEVAARSAVAQSTNNVVTFTPPQNLTIPYGTVIKLRCPVRNPNQNLEGTIPAPTISITNSQYANVAFTSAALPHQVLTTYASHPQLFVSRMAKYYSGKATELLFEFPLLESTAAGTVYAFDLNDGVTFPTGVAEPCVGNNLKLTYDSEDTRAIDIELKTAVTSGFMFSLLCQIVAPPATVAAFVPAEMAFIANSAAQVSVFPALISFTSADYALDVSIQSLTYGVTSKMVVSFHLLDDFSANSIFTLVLNSGFSSGISACNLPGAVTAMNATSRGVASRYTVDFILSSIIRAGNTAVMTCTIVNPSTTIGLPDTPLQVIFDIPGASSPRTLSHQFYIDLVPGFSGRTLLSSYNVDPAATLTIALSFPEPIQSGVLTLAVSNLLPLVNTSCTLLKDTPYASLVAFSMAARDATFDPHLVFHDGFPLGGSLTIACTVSTTPGVIDKTVVATADMTPSVVFSISDLPFPVLETASSTTEVASIVEHTRTVLTNSMWLVRSIPVKTVFSIVMPSIIFTFVDACTFTNYNTKASVTAGNFTYTPTSDGDTKV